MLLLRQHGQPGQLANRNMRFALPRQPVQRMLLGDSSLPVRSRSCLGTVRSLFGRALAEQVVFVVPVVVNNISVDYCIMLSSCAELNNILDSL